MLPLPSEIVEEDALARSLEFGTLSTHAYFDDRKRNRSPSKRAQVSKIANRDTEGVDRVLDAR